MNTSIVPQQPTTARVVSSFSLAFTLGVEDAKAGNPFAPEMYFTHPDDMADYAAGFESVRGVSEITAQFTGTPLPASAPVAPATKPSGWPNWRANKAIKEAEAHSKRIAAAMAATAAFCPELDGDIIFAA